MSIMGAILSVVAMIWTRATVLISLELIHVKNQTMASPVAIADIADVSKIGKNTARYPTTATVIAAFAHQIDTQYPQATKYAAKSPMPNLVYAKGPPLASGTSFPRYPKTTASNTAPKDAHIHPTILIPPKAASAAGNMKMPEPIMFPTTSAVHPQNPIFLTFSMSMSWFYNVLR